MNGDEHEEIPGLLDRRGRRRRARTDGGRFVRAIGRTARGEAEAVFRLEEATIAGLQEMMTSGKETSESLVKLYLERIDKIDRGGPGLNAVIETNPDALAVARELDRERKEKGPRGPLHGVPVVIKDNIDTADGMETTAGSLALLGSKPAKDAFVVERLREAGAVILAKTNLSEWANFRSTRSTSGWSGRGGQTRNPYALDRNPSGSSSGTAAAVSANLAAAGVGTETDGSIVSPASCCGLVGLKPTVGLVSRVGDRPDRPLAGHRRADGPDRRGRGDAPRRDGRARSERSGDADDRRPAFPGLSRIPQAGRIERGAHRRPAGAVVQLRQDARSHPPERHRGHEEGRGGDRRSRRVPDARPDGRRGVRGPSLRVQGRPRGLLSRRGRARPCGRSTTSSPSTRRTPTGRCRSSARRSWSGRPRRAR